MRFLLSNGQQLRIRDATIEDAAALLRMFQQAVSESDYLMTTPAEAQKLSLEQEKEFISTYQNNPNQLFLICEVNGLVSGSLSITRARLSKQHHVGEFGIVVLQKYWNLGIARRMMNAMQQWVENHSAIRYIHLSVLANNEKALHLYRNFGFTEEGRKPKAVLQNGQSYQDIILMGKWIPEKTR